MKIEYGTPTKKILNIIMIIKPIFMIVNIVNIRRPNKVYQTWIRVRVVQQKGHSPEKINRQL